MSKIETIPNCKCGGTLSIVAIMRSEAISLTDISNIDLSTEEGQYKLNNLFDTPSGYTELELSCSMCNDSQPETMIFFEELASHGFRIKELDI